MVRQEFESLKVGDLIWDNDFNTLGEICHGPWTNVGIFNTRRGNGMYVHWDDGDHSCVGFDLITDEEIKHFELLNPKDPRAN